MAKFLMDHTQVKEPFCDMVQRRLLISQRQVGLRNEPGNKLSKQRCGEMNKLSRKSWGNHTYVYIYIHLIYMYTYNFLFLFMWENALV